MTSSVAPEALIRTADPGHAFFARVRFKEDEEEAWETAWFVREDTARIRAFGARPKIEFRVGALEQDGSVLVPILILVGPLRNETLYETWLNAHAAGGGDSLEDLARQPRLPLLFYGDAGERERALAGRNSLAPFFEEVKTRISSVPAWPMAAFDRARERFCAGAPRVMDLWSLLGPMCGSGKSEAASAVLQLLPWSRTVH